MTSSDPVVLEKLPRAELESVAAGLARLVKPRDVIALYGDLGAGKTVFARAFIRALTNGDEDVPSPTFTLVQTYDAPAGLTIWHFDLYRLKSAQEIYEIGFEEALEDGVSLIEWPQRAERLLPRNRLEIDIQIPPDDPDVRTMTLTPRDEDWQKRTEKLNRCRNAQNA